MTARDAADQGLRRLGRVRRSDPAEIALWYFVNAHTRRQHEGQRERLLQPERRRSRRSGCTRPISAGREYSDRTFENASGRVTWQVDAAQQGQRLLGCAGAVPDLHGRHARPCRSPQRVSPEAVGVLGRPLRCDAGDVVVAASRTGCSLEAGFGGTYFGVGNFERDPNPTRDLIRVAEQCASGCAANGNIPGLVYRSQDFSVAHTGSYLWKGSLSYVTGTHSLKVGYQHTLMTDDRTWMTNNQNLTYRVQQRRAESADRVDLAVGEQRARRRGTALFVQEQWTRDRLTLQGARAIRSGTELVSGAAGRAVAIPAHADRHSRNTRRRQLQGRHAADGRRLRPVRDRQDGAQDDPRQVPRGRRRVRQLRQHQPHAADAADDVGRSARPA